MMTIFLILGALAFLPMMFDTSSGPDDEVEGDPDDGGGTDGPGDLLGESLIGSGDSDTLSGSGGDIYPVDNETGDDTIYGGSGADTVIGGVGYDLFYGGADGDTFQGWNGADTLYGAGGDDSLTGDYGNDLAFGGEGNDTFSWMASNDTSYGGAGHENIFDVQQTYDSVPNISLMDGGAGNDSLSFEAGSTITGGTGDDSMWLYAGLGETAVTVITDFDPDEDSILIDEGSLLPGTTPQIVIWEDDTGCDIMTGDIDMARVSGGQGLTTADIGLAPSLF
jgi:Ca2+-binding RTX toxin-like protein